MNFNISLLLIQLLNPFVGLLRGILKFDSRESKILIYLFLCFYSYTYLPIPHSDATRYETEIKQYQNIEFSEYITELGKIYSTESKHKDAYIITSLYVLGKFTNDPKIYRLFYGMVYYAVFLSFLSALRRTANNENKIFIIGLAFIIAISSGINGIRWPLAFMIFLTGIAYYIESLNYRYLFLSCASVFIHFSLLFMLPMLFIYLLLIRNYKDGKTLILILVLVLSLLNIDYKQQINILGEGLADASSGYVLNENFREDRASHLSSLNWYIIVNRFSTYYFGLAFVLFCVYRNNKLIKSTRVLRLEILVLLSYFFSFISGSFLDVLSNRYYLISNAMFLMYAYFLTMDRKNYRIVGFLKWFYVPIILLNMAIVIRADSYTVSPLLIFGNWLLTILDGVEMNFYELSQGLR